MKIHNKKLQKAIALAFAGAATLLVGSFAQQSQADNLTAVSVTLSNSRPSFVGEVGAGNTVGSSQLVIDTSGVPSTSTDQLNAGDSIDINSNTYTVVEVLSSDTLTVSPALQAGDADANDPIVGLQISDFTAAFTTASAVNNGHIEILVPAASSNSTDGTPDIDAFDTDGVAAATLIDCPTNTTGYDFSTTPDETITSTTIDGQDYHVFRCGYAGTGAASTALTMTLNSLINPPPTSGHTTGTADSYQVIIRNTDSSDGAIDATATSIGLIEAVRISATVAPQLTFQIGGVASSQTSCNVSTDVTTTALAVPFGEVPIDGFTDAAQTLTVSTNAGGGYAVTAIANNQLGKYGSGATCTGDATTGSDTDCIQDSRGDTTTMTHTTADEFDNITSKGFAYSLENDDAAAVAFQYSDSTGGCTGTYCAKQFADAEGTESPVSLFSSTTVADGENIDICYRIIPDVTTEAGEYTNYVTYTATATF